MDNQIVELFQQGVDDYWAGHVPDGWDDVNQLTTSPYLTGWFMESMFDTGSWDMDERNR